MPPDVTNLSQISAQNELLCFCINKSQVMPFETIVKLCSDFYSGEEIHSAKELLWELVISVIFPSRKDLRLIRRKSTSTGSKNRADMEDILKALQVCDRESVILPKFYAVDLGNIPPVSVEHLDMSVLLSQFGMMQSEMRHLRLAVQSLQDTAPKTVTSPMSYAQAAGSQLSPPRQLPPAPPPPSSAGQAVGPQSVTAVGLQPSPPLPPPSPPPPASPLLPLPSGGSVGQTAQAGSEPTNQNGSLTRSEERLVNPQQPVPPPSVQPRQKTDGDGFTEVTRRKAKRSRLVVTGVSSSTLLRGVAAPPRTMDLFVGRLDPNTSTQAVESHVNWLLGGGEKAVVTEIAHCAEAYGYKGFKVTIPVDTVGRVLVPDKWPTHVSIKKFYQPRAARAMNKPGQESANPEKRLKRSVSVDYVAG